MPLDEEQLSEASREPAGLVDDLRRLEHDLNGILNQLTLHLELLDLAPGASADDTGRTRHLASLRRSLHELREMVRTRVPAIGGTSGTGRHTV